MNKKIILGYIMDLDPNREPEITDEELKKLTHLNIAFATINNNGDIKTDHLKIFNRISHFKSVNPDLKVLASLNSGEYESFSGNASTKEGREKIAKNSVEMIKKYNLDGVDMDWEFPCIPSNNIASSHDDKENFTLLCKTIREEIDKIGDKHYLFTIAAGGDQYYVDSTNMNEVHKYLDFVCLMTYDLKCGFHALTGHHTNLFLVTGDIFRCSCARAIEIFNNAGVPKEKLVMGAAFYSRMWTEVQNKNNGFLQHTKSGGGYGPSYTQLFNEYIDKNGYTKYWDDEAKAPYLFNPEKGEFISYDDPISIKHKCEYIKANDIGGIFYWDHESDKTGQLLEACYANLNK